MIIESNLLWSSKLKLGVKALGHEAEVVPDVGSERVVADLAIVNLSQSLPDPTQLIGRLRKAGVKVIAHAGHKEKDLLQLGKQAGADLLVTNGELSGRLQSVLDRASGI